MACVCKSVMLIGSANMDKQPNYQVEHSSDHKCLVNTGLLVF